MRDMTYRKLEKMKQWKLDDISIFSYLSRTQKQALIDIHKCVTWFDIIELFSRSGCTIKGFSDSNYIKLKKDVENLFGETICCYKNQYVEIEIPNVIYADGDEEIKITVKNHYPVDNALKVGFKKEDIWGHKMLENDKWWHHEKSWKGYIWISIDNLPKSELILRFSKGERILSTDFYELECSVEVIEDSLQLDDINQSLNDPQKRNAVENPYMCEEKKINAINFLNYVGVLTNKEKEDIINYLNEKAYWVEDDDILIEEE